MQLLQDKINLQEKEHLKYSMSNLGKKKYFSLE